MVKNNMDRLILETEIEIDYARSNQDALLTAGDFTGANQKNVNKKFQIQRKRKVDTIKQDAKSSIFIEIYTMFLHPRRSPHFFHHLIEN
jgi:hypothetical protein